MNGKQLMRMVGVVLAAMVVLGAGSGVASAEPVGNVGSSQHPGNGGEARSKPKIKPHLHVELFDLNGKQVLALKGTGFSPNGVGIVATDKDGYAIDLALGGWCEPLGPSFLFVTWMEHCRRGGPVTRGTIVFAIDHATDLTSNTVTLITCS